MGSRQIPGALSKMHSGTGVNLTSYFHLMLRLGMNGSIPPIVGIFFNLLHAPLLLVIGIYEKGC